MMKWMVLVLVLLLTGCTMIVTREKSEPLTLEESRVVVEDFIRSSATYVFDGSELKYVEHTSMTCDGCYQFTYEFISSHSGYGNRQGQMVAQVEIPHTVEVTVINGRIPDAIMDDQWDMLNQKMLSMNVPPCEMNKPDVIGMCEKLFGYYYDVDENKCLSLSGCNVEGDVPFSINAQAICEATCVKQVDCPADVFECWDRSTVSRDPANDCEFKSCPFMEQEKTYCSEAERKANMCTADYRPVCGYFSQEVQCVKAPCASTYSNPCMACSDDHVQFWVEGEC